MTVSELREIALSLKEVTEDIKWGDHVCFSVSGKMFLITAPDQVPSTSAFKVAPGKFEETITRPGFAKHKHLGRYHWIRLDDINRLTTGEWKHFIMQSYQLVVDKFLKKTKKKPDL